MAPDIDARGGDVAEVLFRVGNTGGAGSAVISGGICFAGVERGAGGGGEGKGGGEEGGEEEGNVGSHFLFFFIVGLGGWWG